MTITVIKHALYIFAVFLFVLLFKLNSNLEKEALTLKSKLNKFEVKSPKMIEKHPKMIENILNKNILEFNKNINNITKYK